MVVENFFKNKFNLADDIYVYEKKDGYAENFGKQWKAYRDVQIDSINQNKISYQYLEDLTFNELENFSNKSILEIGCGAGRFTEILINKSKLCIAVDLSSAVYYNVSKGEKNLFLIKSNFLKLVPKDKFDIVICRGVLQHTEEPNLSIMKLFDFVKEDGIVYFDIYKKPFFKLHPKYTFWRPLISTFFTYEKFEKFLIKRIKILIKIKKFLINNILFSKKLSDIFIPIYYYKNELNLSDNELEKWAILDTLDGMYAKYDKPMYNSEVVRLLQENNIQLLKNNMERNFFKAKLNA